MDFIFLQSNSRLKKMPFDSISQTDLRRVIYTVMLTVIYLGTSAQSTPDSTFKDSATINYLASRTPLGISYYGNVIVNPGVKVFTEWNLLAIQKNKVKRRKQKEKPIRKLLYLQPSLSYYYHKRSHSAFQLSMDLGWRRYRPKLFYTDMAFGLGYMRRFNIGDTYIADDQGNITNQKNATSRGYFVPNFSFAVGKHLQLKNNNGLSVFTRINGYLMLNYNSGFVPDASIEFGVKYNYAQLFNNHSKIKMK
jgi:hypothetical protein